MDYNMNTRAKTLNVAYSPRGVPGAPVSMPLTWEALEKAHPLDFTMENALARLEKTGDAWKDALRFKQNIEALINGKAELHVSFPRKREFSDFEFGLNGVRNLPLSIS